MTHAVSRLALAAAIVCVTAVPSRAQVTSSSSETKAFEVIAVDGNLLVVRLPEGTREINVPDDFRFTVNGKPLSVRELKPGMKGSATITTKTTITPVTVTEVKNGTVVARSGSNLIVRTGNDVRMFTQGEIDKRGVKIMRDGKPAQLSQFREGDQLTALIITSAPPRVMTEKEVQATTAQSAAATAGGAGGAGRAPSTAAPASAAAPPSAAAAKPAPAQAQTTAGARTLPKTASSWPLLALASVLSLAVGLALTLRRRLG